MKSQQGEKNGDEMEEEFEEEKAVIQKKVKICNPMNIENNSFSLSSYPPSYNLLGKDRIEEETKNKSEIDGALKVMLLQIEQAKEEFSKIGNRIEGRLKQLENCVNGLSNKMRKLEKDVKNMKKAKNKKGNPNQRNQGKASEEEEDDPSEEENSSETSEGSEEDEEEEEEEEDQRQRKYRRGKK